MWHEATPIVFAASLGPLLVLLTIGLLMVINRHAEECNGPVRGGSNDQNEARPAS